MSKLAKRQVWRPVIAGEKVSGGAGGFHLPQREGRTNYLNYVAPKSKGKRKGARKAKR